MRNHKLSRFLSNEKALQREIRSLTHSRDVLAVSLIQRTTLLPLLR